MSNTETSTHMVDTMLDAQKQMINALVDNTKKFTSGNNVLTEAIEKGSHWYNNMVENQKNMLNQTTTEGGTLAANAQQNSHKLTDFYNNWMSKQQDWAKQMWDMNTNFVQNGINQMQNPSGANTDAHTNPMHHMNNMMGNMNNMGNQWSNWMNNMNTANTAANMMNPNHFMNQMHAHNPFNHESWKTMTEGWNKMFNQYNEILNNSFSQIQQNMNTVSAQDAHRNMMNVTENYNRFYQLWMPMWKSIQEKTFNMDAYRQMMNPNAFQEMLDKYFGFIPENGRHYMQNMANMMQQWGKQSGSMGLHNFQQMRNSMQNIPGMAQGNIYENMLSGYSNMHNLIQQSVSPLMRMMTPNQQTKSMQDWSDIANRTMVLSIKNAELQNMMYQQGSKVMDKLAENITNKVQNGEEINSLMNLYQEWLNMSDKTYVELFESDKYSMLMAEVSAMQLKLRKDLETQTEALLSASGMPVATRSEMDELYKTIYELRKEIREMGRKANRQQEEANHSESSVETTPSAEATNHEATTASSEMNEGTSLNSELENVTSETEVAVENNGNTAKTGRRKN